MGLTEGKFREEKDSMGTVLLPENAYFGASTQRAVDIIPTVIHISALSLIMDRLVSSLACLEEALTKKASEFMDIKKIGRTHLQDAVPLSLGQDRPVILN